MRSILTYLKDTCLRLGDPVAAGSCHTGRRRDLQGYKGRCMCQSPWVSVRYLENSHSKKVPN